MRTLCMWQKSVVSGGLEGARREGEKTTQLPLPPVLLLVQVTKSRYWKELQMQDLGDGIARFRQDIAIPGGHHFLRAMSSHLSS